MSKIDKVYAFIAENSPGDEGVIGSRIKVNQLVNGEVVVAELWLPLMAASKETMESLIPQAETMADMLGKPVKIIAFGKGDMPPAVLGEPREWGREEVATLWPRGPAEGLEGPRG